jgi:hypothetical protein
MRLWQLAQTFWVGAFWSLHFVFLPVLQRMGMAPMLVDEIDALLSPMLVGFAVASVLLQGVVLIGAQGIRSLWRDLRGQLLCLVLLVSLAYLTVRHWQPEAEFWLRFCYLVLAFCGLVLVLQPLPGQRRELVRG